MRQFGLALLLLLCTGLHTASAAVVSRIAAVVNKDIITTYQLDQKLQEQLAMRDTQPLLIDLPPPADLQVDPASIVIPSSVRSGEPVQIGRRTAASTASSRRGSPSSPRRPRCPRCPRCRRGGRGRRSRLPGRPRPGSRPLSPALSDGGGRLPARHRHQPEPLGRPSRSLPPALADRPRGRGARRFECAVVLVQYVEHSKQAQHRPRVSLRPRSRDPLRSSD